MRTAFRYAETPVVVTHDSDGWHLQVGAAAPISHLYLDATLSEAFPNAAKRELDRLLLQLLAWSLDGRRETVAEPVDLAP